MVTKGAETATATKDFVENDYDLSHREKQVMRRIDLRLVLGAALGYSVNLKDRGNVGMAAIAGWTNHCHNAHGQE
ncbi:uncharacterized protein N7473_008870 [Penicillium subrubescens]|uniref:Uncharacterized protein n=1 Tax=Penicillium subrubescens TaxID=1316194 RepID=A0A1Q5U753_9EURO|nr:uncharacterized protein N7473_008870 [Penicillium subrubescens]KAJ5886196.1 hypothetical protein N7473_008870 [Penicillium subrubescens]OKP08306.1 hypothetical protein PENSUB_5673 [Penicillium subrubescens]